MRLTPCRSIVGGFFKPTVCVAVFAACAAPFAGSSAWAEDGVDPWPRSFADQSLCGSIIVVSKQSTRSTFDVRTHIFISLSMNAEDASADSDKLE